MLSCAADKSSLTVIRRVSVHQESNLDLFLGYIDPGSGSIMIQALIAGLVALPIFFRQHIARAIRVVRGTGEATSEPTVSQDDSAAKR